MIIWTFAFNLTVVGNLKTVIIMANIKLVFQGTEKSQTNEHELVCYHNASNEIFICIESDYPAYICLDKSTAVKLVKHLKLQISYIESEVDNG